MPPLAGCSSLSSSLDMPGKFSATRIVRTKSSPTTQVTTNDMDWEVVFHSPTAPGEQVDAKGSKTNANARASGSTSHSRGTTRWFGLLTPHASVNENLVEDYRSARSNVPSTPSTHNRSEISDIRFATPEGSLNLNDELNLLNTPRARESTSCTSSTANTSYESVGVQTSLPYTSSSASPAPPSPITPSHSTSATPTATPKRKRRSVPGYVREGELMARQLSEDLTYLSHEKRRLRRSLADVERKERQLKSLLISWPRSSDEDEKTETEEDTSDKECDSLRRVRFRSRVPLTPVSSDYEKKVEIKVNSSELSTPTQPRVTFSDCSSSLASGYARVNAIQQPSSSSRTAVDHIDDSSASTDSALRVPGYTFAEGSSTPSSTISILDDTQRSQEEDFDLAPNPVRDPSTYLIWFDLETTDAVRPAPKIKILEVAILITDKNYRRLDKGKSFIVHWPLSAEDIAKEMPKRVRDMHEKSGLLSAYAATPPKERLTLPQVERRICKYLDRHDIGSDGHGIMAGAGVAFDRGMVRQHMEKLDKYFSHQIFDTTTLWHAIRRKYNRTKRFSVSCAHRALDDIIESSREAKLYSELVLRPSGEVHWPSESSQGI